eukprot:1098023-Rhodomonas_salina.1
MPTSTSESRTPKTMTPTSIRTMQSSCSSALPPLMSPNPTVVNTVHTKYLRTPPAHTQLSATRAPTFCSAAAHSASLDSRLAAPVSPDPATKCSRRWKHRACC